MSGTEESSSVDHVVGVGSITVFADLVPGMWTILISMIVKGDVTRKYERKISFRNFLSFETEFFWSD